MKDYAFIKEIQPALFGQISLYRSKETGELVVMKSVDLELAKAKRTIYKSQVDDNPWTELEVLQFIQSKGGHKNTISYKGVHYDSKKMHLEMEFCSRGDLYRHVRKKKLQRKDIVEVFSQIVAGVSQMHSLGFAHRDLSLENILLHANGTLKLCDFGLVSKAKSLVRNQVGKLLYMAPEVASPDNSEYCPIKADMWSLGIILFTLLTQSFPFRTAVFNDPNFSYFCFHGLEKLTQSQNVDKMIPSDALDLLQSLLHVKPSKRFNLEKVLQHSFLKTVS